MTTDIREINEKIQKESAFVDILLLEMEKDFFHIPFVAVLPSVFL